MAERRPRRAWLRVLHWLSSTLLLQSCGPEADSPVGTEGVVEGSASGGTSPISESTTSGFTDAVTTSSAPNTSADDSTTTDPVAEACPSYFNADLGVDGACDEIVGRGLRPPDCSRWYDECPPGMKCGHSDVCEEVALQPRQMYETCTGGGVTPDDCDRGLSCLRGICLGLCQCNDADPHCTDPNAQCLYSSECYPACDLLDPACPPGYGCIAFGIGAFCYPVLGIGAGPPGTSCDEFEDCAPGTICYGDSIQDVPSQPPTEHSQTRVPGCASEFKCCAELCRLPDGACSQPGATCTVYTVDEVKIPCFGVDTGVCLLPA